MDILIIGGTQFLGRHIVEAALAAGHHLTLFNRGRTNPDLFPMVEKVHGDRATDLSVLQGRHWDAAIDLCGYLPRVVRASAELLAGTVAHYTFISSISVYTTLSRPGMDESAPLGVLDDPGTEQITNETYGPLKALCEQMVEQALPDRSLIIRPGYIVGPHDPTDRFTYWPHRVARGGEVLSPGSPELLVQFIDVRDLAEWIVRLVASGTTGSYNATGPDYELSMGRLLAECKQLTDSDAHFSWVSEDFLDTHHAELPIWVPASEANFASINCQRALDAGLIFRPLSETIRATLEWDLSRPAGYTLRAGLGADQEAALLHQWHER
ncbi:MAG TPA: SDR family oxidoreductase [Ktedonobacteraceae bacterium]|nr:SDR family oxidoreductase [Ktedonobacteraceae bacterium]